MESKLNKPTRVRRREGFIEAKNPSVLYLNIDTPGASFIALPGSYYLWRVVQRTLLKKSSEEQTVLFTLRNMAHPKEVRHEILTKKVSTEEIV